MSLFLLLWVSYSLVLSWFIDLFQKLAVFIFQHRSLNASKGCWKLLGSMIKWWRSVHTAKVLTPELFLDKRAWGGNTFFLMSGLGFHCRIWPSPFRSFAHSKRGRSPRSGTVWRPTFLQKVSWGSGPSCASHSSLDVRTLGICSLMDISSLCCTVEEVEILFSQRVWLVTYEFRESWFPWYTTDTDFSTILEMTGKPAPPYSSGTVTCFWF